MALVGIFENICLAALYRHLSTNDTVLAMCQIVRDLVLVMARAECIRTTMLPRASRLVFYL